MIRLLGLAAAAAILWIAFREVNVRRVREMIAGLGWPALLIPLPMLVTFCCETLGWRGSFRVIGRRVPFWPLLRVRITTDALTHSLPGGVLFCESAALLLLKRHCKVPLDEGAAGLAARKFLLLASQALYVGLIFAFGYSYLRSSSERVLGSDGLPWVALAISLILATAAFAFSSVLRRGALASRIHNWLLRLPTARLRGFLQKQRDKFEQTDDHMARWFGAGPRRLTAPAPWFLAGWIAESFETWLILHLLGVELPFVAVASFEVVLAFLRHVLVILPAGLGVQDAGYAAFLAALGVPEALSAGAAFVLLKRSKEVLWAALGYALLLTDRIRTPDDRTIGVERELSAESA